MIKIYVPQDMVACAHGADELASALSNACAVEGWQFELIRNGSRGLFWLETLVEIETDGERIALGPLNEQDADSVVEALKGTLSDHPKYLGDIEQHAYFVGQQRLTFARAGLGNPLCIEHYKSLKGFDGLSKALEMDAQAIVDAVKE